MLQMASSEKNAVLINTARYIDNCFKKDLPESLIEQISNFIPKVIQGLPVGADVDTFSCSYSLAQTVLRKGGNKTFFARRRLINLFKQQLEMSAGYYPNHSVVSFARTHLETDSKHLPKQLAVMFNNLFSSTSPVDQFYIQDALDTLLEDLHAEAPLVTPRCTIYFEALVQFVGRSDELGVQDVRVMTKMGQYIVKQTEAKPELWTHIETAHVLPKQTAGGIKEKLHHRAAHRLRLLTWVMLALGSETRQSDTHSGFGSDSNQHSDDESPIAPLVLEVKAEQVESLTMTALQGLVNNDEVSTAAAQPHETALLHVQ